MVAGSLLLLAAINIAGVRWAANVSMALVFGKLVPLLLFLGIGVFHVDWQLAFGGEVPAALDWRRPARPPCCCCSPTPASRTCRWPRASTATRGATCRSRWWR